MNAVFDDPISEEFGKIDVQKYNLEKCATALDPVGPYYRDDVYVALTRARGNVSRAAGFLNRRRRNLARYLEANLDLKSVAEDFVETDLDELEEKSMDLAKEQDGAQMRFLLQTKGKDRGYTTRQEHTGKDGKDLRMAIENTMSDEQMVRMAEEIAKRAEDV